ncbi:MAG: non-canonical purine NTP pyrophosphatase, RdgB/HAM1 family [Gammaproteobacteria bacterium HGW-Gammaproteobacteria-11]|nr:MAG: non-canonical purine NTP pyrophosphatase, RdgB/HAM1 family [Gammaproteobacteria bacterium HGW-Gammaproteobacteria-11]
MTSNTLPFEQLVLASGNPGKLRELQAMLGEQVKVRPQSEFVAEEAVENGLSFVENAIIKARHACLASGLPALADDSGLAVDALGGAPGIYSARYAGSGGDAANNRKLLDALDGLPTEQRNARFISVLVLMLHAEDPTPIICEGIWHGRILTEPRGEQGFGYDPLFWVPEANCASAELSPAEKNRLSHRAKAMAQLRVRLGIEPSR